MAAPLATLHLATPRLTLAPLAPTDAPFMRALVTSPGWLAFIGDRGVATDADAAAYVARILALPATYYWVVRTGATPVGVVTFMQRAGATAHDLGFALLPAHAGHGFAHEAASALLAHLRAVGAWPTIEAITLPHNHRSIALLTRLGFAFVEARTADGEALHVYAIAAG